MHNFWPCELINEYSYIELDCFYIFMLFLLDLFIHRHMCLQLIINHISGHRFLCRIIWYDVSNEKCGLLMQDNYFCYMLNVNTQNWLVESWSHDLYQCCILTQNNILTSQYFPILNVVMVLVLWHHIVLLWSHIVLLFDRNVTSSTIVSDVTIGQYDFTIVTTMPQTVDNDNEMKIFYFILFDHNIQIYITDLQ